MKKLILLCVILISAALTSLTFAAVQGTGKSGATSDSIEIVKISDSKYYVIEAKFSLDLKHKILQRKIIDSLTFISPEIPKEIWAMAYKKVLMVYESKVNEPGRLEIRNWQPKFIWVFNEKSSVLSESRLTSISYSYETDHYELAMPYAGWILLIIFTLLGLVAGWLMLPFNKENRSFSKKRFSFFGHLILVVAISVIFAISNGPSNLSFLIPAALYIFGVFISFILWRQIYNYNKRKSARQIKEADEEEY